jgi:N-acetylglucosamine kinase-like BadF-type ATPase
MVLGFEGGGSHGHAIVADHTGAVLGIGTIEDSTNWEDVGIEAAGAATKACVRWALQAAGLLPEAILASVFSLAGVDFPLDADLLEGIPVAMGLRGSLRILNDAYASLRAGTDRPYGVVVSAGTGAIAAGRNPDGAEYRTLGQGPLFGDSGSASEVSEAGVSAVAAAYTGRGSPTILSERLATAAGVGSVAEFLEGAARGRIDPVLFAPIVIGAAGEGDEVAVGILAAAGESLGDSAVHVIRKLSMETTEFDLVLAGGLFRGAGSFLVDPLRDVVRPIAPKATAVVLREPPVIGSVLLAIELAEVAPSAETRQRISESAMGAIGEYRPSES